MSVIFKDTVVFVLVRIQPEDIFILALCSCCICFQKKLFKSFRQIEECRVFARNCPHNAQDGLGG